MDNKCGCGCGETVKNEFAKGHYARLMLRRKATCESLFENGNHPDCIKLNPETKCRRCIAERKLNKEAL
jgi:hypothetical protein